MSLFDRMAGHLMSVQLRTFATDCIYGEGDAVVTFKGIFDRRHFTVSGPGEVPVSVTAPTLTYRKDEIVPEQFHPVTVDGVRYTIQDIQPEGGDAVTLILHEAEE